MNLTKLRSLLPKGLAIDIKDKADTIRFSNKIGDDTSWFEVSPSMYKNEEELASAIKNYLSSY